MRKPVVYRAENSYLGDQRPSPPIDPDNFQRFHEGLGVFRGQARYHCFLTVIAQLYPGPEPPGVYLSGLDLAERDFHRAEPVLKLKFVLVDSYGFCLLRSKYYEQEPC